MLFWQNKRGTAERSATLRGGVRVFKCCVRGCTEKAEILFTDEKSGVFTFSCWLHAEEVIEHRRKRGGIPKSMQTHELREVKTERARANSRPRRVN